MKNTFEYGDLAEVYDHLFEAGPAFQRARRAVLGPVLPKISTACDLCCGTGTYALELAARGLRVYGVDLSRTMLRVARRKAGKNKLVTFLEGDMRNFTLPAPVDLLTCEYDALNHLPRHNDLPKVFRAAARALKPGGWFAFDTNNLAAFETIWAKTWFLEQPPVALVMEGQHRPGASRATVDVHWFVKQGYAWRRHDEHIEEICWPAETIRAELEKAGFEDIQEWDAAPFFKQAHTKPGNRTFWRAKLKA